MNRREFFQRTVGTTIGAIVISKAAAQESLIVPVAGQRLRYAQKAFGYRNTLWVGLVDGDSNVVGPLQLAKIKVLEQGADIRIELAEQVSFQITRSAVVRPAFFLENDPLKPVFYFDLDHRGPRAVLPGDTVNMISPSIDVKL